MIWLLVVLAVIIVLAALVGFGGIGYRGFGDGGPVVHRRIVYRRRPVRRVYTEHHVVEDAPPPLDGPTYRP